MARSKRKRTRQSCSNSPIGGPSDFIANEVPTLRDCLRKIKFLQLSNSSETINNVIKEVANEVVRKWQVSNTLFREPITVSERTIFLRLKRAFETLVNENHKKKSIKKKHFKHALNSKLDTLFDIIHCKCAIYSCDGPCSQACSVSIYKLFDYLVISIYGCTQYLCYP